MWINWLFIIKKNIKKKLAKKYLFMKNQNKYLKIKKLKLPVKL